MSTATSVSQANGPLEEPAGPMGGTGVVRRGRSTAARLAWSSLRKVLMAIPVLIIVTFVTSSLSVLMKVDPAVQILGSGATPEAVAALNKQYGFNRPLIAQYLSWLGHAIRGDLGSSFYTQQPVTQALGQRLPVTVQLALMALIVALILAVPAAVACASRPRSWLDRVCSFLASVFMSLPAFVMAPLVVYFLAVKVELFPVTGWVPLTENVGQNLYHVILPVFVLMMPQCALFFRLFRGDVAATLQQDFVLSARAKGLSRGYVLYRHVFRPSSYSLIAMIGLAIGQLLGGAVIAEFYFGLPGIGSLLLAAIPQTDLPVISGVVSLVAVVYVVVNILVDLVVALVDPRVKGV